jgi:hypothetical protein
MSLEAVSNSTFLAIERWFAVRDLEQALAL